MIGQHRATKISYLPTLKIMAKTHHPKYWSPQSRALQLNEPVQLSKISVAKPFPMPRLILECSDGQQRSFTCLALRQQKYWAKLRLIDGRRSRNMHEYTHNALTVHKRYKQFVIWCWTHKMAVLRDRSTRMYTATSVIDLRQFYGMIGSHQIRTFPWLKHTQLKLSYV